MADETGQFDERNPPPWPGGEIIPFNRNAAPPTGPLDWLTKHVLTDAEADDLKDPEFAYPNLIIAGHFIAFVAEPMAGKTTLMVNHVCPMLASAGYQVVYVNADTSAGDAKSMLETARRHGFSMLTPELKGNSMDDVVKSLEEMASREMDYSGHIFFFDTLKKMTDVISKSKAKALYQLLRSLTAKGMTCVVLAHTNKYKGEDGSPIFEGTGDLRSDVDELIYLIPEKHADGSLTVSTDPHAPTAKVRGVFKAITFNIAPDRTVTASDEFVDVRKRSQEAVGFEANQHIISAILDAIHAECRNEVQIIGAVRARFEKEGVKAVGDKRMRKILMTYADSKNSRQAWRRERGMNFHWRYFAKQ